MAKAWTSNSTEQMQAALNAHQLAKVVKEPQKPVRKPVCSALARCSQWPFGSTASGLPELRPRAEDELSTPITKQPTTLAGRSMKRAPPGLPVPSAVTHAAHFQVPHLSPEHSKRRSNVGHPCIAATNGCM
jgi:hypothetical protein